MIKLLTFNTFDGGGILMGIAKVLYDNLRDTAITDAMKDIDQTYLRSLLLSDENVNELKKFVNDFIITILKLMN
jgi:hypothetical protein